MFPRPGETDWRQTVDREVAAHQAAELAADGQAEAGAAEPAGGRGIGLREGLEELAELFGRHADAGVADAETQGLADALHC